MILAVMFLGAAVHRTGNGGADRRCVAGTAAGVLVCAVASAYRGGDGGRFTRQGWILAFLLAVFTFGAGLAARHLRVPRPLTAPGTISYLVYLVHPVLPAAADGTVGRWRHDAPALEAAFLAVLLPLCALTHRYVEVPGQAWGRRLARRVQPGSRRGGQPMW
ncbi:acyltransferase family protein [Streptomyces sp. NBC_00637]|uniref:acyltransferase family protein n=1 Tax=Streptomyces sp. NBC_00637 TaxID=2903667 RepID=UPI00386D2B3E